MLPASLFQIKSGRASFGGIAVLAPENFFLGFPYLTDPTFSLGFVLWRVVLAPQKYSWLGILMSEFFGSWELVLCREDPGPQA